MRISHLAYILVIAALCGMGVLFLYSTGYLGPEYAVRSNYLRQCLFIGLGASVACGIVALSPGRSAWRAFVFGGYGVSLLLLLLVLVFGKSIGGARRWLSVGAFLLQPAEFARVFTIAAGALLLDGRTLPRRWEAIVGAICFIVPMALILLEPSYGNAASLAVPMAVIFGMRYLPRPVWTLAMALGVAMMICAGAAVWHLRTQPPAERGVFIGAEAESSFFRGYHLRRLDSFLSPEGGWNEQQSLMAVSGGGLTGKGYLNGTMKNLGFLPRTVAPTDFIFAVVAEEGGLLFGVLPLMLLYWMLFAILATWASRAQDRLALNMIAGGMALLFTHVVVGVGMAVRLLPIIGLPLPLLSYGGSFTLSVFILLGAMASAECHRTGLHADKSAQEEDTGSCVLRVGHLLKIHLHRK